MTCFVCRSTIPPWKKDCAPPFAPSHGNCRHAGGPISRAVDRWGLRRWISVRGFSSVQGALDASAVRRACRSDRPAIQLIGDLVQFFRRFSLPSGAMPSACSLISFVSFDRFPSPSVVSLESPAAGDATSSLVDQSDWARLVRPCHLAS